MMIYSRLTVLLFVFIPLSALGGSGSHAGDLVYNTLLDGLASAANILSSLDTEDFKELVNKERREWFASSFPKLKSTLSKAELKETDAPQLTCLSTDLKPGATIWVNLRQCLISVRDERDAIFIILHEAAHQAGVAAEILATEIARDVLSVWNTKQNKCVDVTGDWEYRCDDGIVSSGIISFMQSACSTIKIDHSDFIPPYKFGNTLKFSIDKGLGREDFDYILLALWATDRKSFTLKTQYRSRDHKTGTDTIEVNNATYNVINANSMISTSSQAWTQSNSDGKFSVSSSETRCSYTRVK